MVWTSSKSPKTLQNQGYNVDKPAYQKSHKKWPQKTSKKEKLEKEKDELKILANNLIKQPWNLLYKTWPSTSLHTPTRDGKLEQEVLIIYLYF